jgi:hypothetical protein
MPGSTQFFVRKIGAAVRPLRGCPRGGAGAGKLNSIVMQINNSPGPLNM